MTYEELVAKTKEFYKDADAKAVAEHVAVQFNIAGEAEGAFYVEVAEGKVNVEPFEYFDRDAIAYTSAGVVSDITDSKVSFADAVSNGSINVEGNILKALLLNDVKKAVKKATAKKSTTEKKETKSTAKKAEPAKAVKAEAKKAEPAKAVKAEAKKAEPAKAIKAEAKKAEPAKSVKAEAKKADVKVDSKAVDAIKTTAKVAPVATKTVKTEAKKAVAKKSK